MDKTTNCLLCDGPAKRPMTPAQRVHVECNRCGTYEATRSLVATWERNESIFKKLRPYLACHTKQATEKGIVPRFDTYDWESIAKRHAESSPMRRADLALSFIVRESRRQQDRAFGVSIDQGLYFDAVTGGQVSRILEHLLREGLIVGVEQDGVPQHLKGIVPDLAIPTLKGEQHYWLGGDPVKSTTCFVAMSFDGEHTAIFDEAIQPAAKECGYAASRVDLREFNGEITDEIMAGIRRSRFLIADFTGHKGGVYFEAGFALGLGREVIFTCQKGDLKGCHFDTKHYKHIDWIDAQDLRKRLISRIMGTIGPPVRD